MTQVNDIGELTDKTVVALNHLASGNSEPYKTLRSQV